MQNIKNYSGYSDKCMQMDRQKLVSSNKTYLKIVVLSLKVSEL
jgi:hypothetical protein